jgi:two-component system nitrogen regulation response regulator GlnG
VGGVTPITVNVRVIAATHQDMETRVREGLFREDLYHRLNVIRLRLPSLRERRDDIALLARHFLQKSARALGVEAKRLTEAAIAQIALHDFPGNVRQLENLCHWVTVMAPGQSVDFADLPPEFRSAAAPGLLADGDWRKLLAREVDALLAQNIPDVHGKLSDQFEATLIRQALAHTGGRRIEAAQLLGIGRNTLTRKVQDLGLDAAEGEG